MARDDSQKAWISAYNKDVTLRWNRILLNNGKSATTVADQIKFHNSDQCGFPFGMKVMYSPQNGRLNYARSRIQAIWIHYNHFGLHPDGSSNNHTGDTMISLDADTGYNQKIFWAHSLIQNVHFDGKYLFVSLLGDTYPMNILFKVCDMEKHECKSKQTLIPGEIPENGGGKAACRQNFFVDIVGNRNEKSLFTKKKLANEDILDLFQRMIKIFDKDLNFISTNVLIENELASRVNTIQTGRYGKNILVAYSKIPTSKVINFNCQKINENFDESYLLLLNGEDGSPIYGPIKKDSYQVSASVDWRILEDGRIVYTFINKDNSLNFYYTPKLKTPQFSNLIEFSEKVYGFRTFLNTNITPKKNNFNDIIFKPGDSNYSIVDFIIGNNNNREIYIIYHQQLFVKKVKFKYEVYVIQNKKQQFYNLSKILKFIKKIIFLFLQKRNFILSHFFRESLFRKFKKLNLKSRTNN